MIINYNPKITAKDYSRCFDVSLRTAQRMILNDKIKRKKTLLTALDFYEINGFHIVPICANIAKTAKR